MSHWENADYQCCYDKMLSIQPEENIMSEAQDKQFQLKESSSFSSLLSKDN